MSSFFKKFLKKIKILSSGRANMRELKEVGGGKVWFKPWGARESIDSKGLRI